jgi:hypothetical protein
MHPDDAQLMTLMVYVQNAGTSDDNTFESTTQHP